MVNKRADSVFTRDKKRRKPFALTATREAYKMKIHKAVVDGGLYDPLYRRNLLAWDLIGTWDTSHKQPDGYEKKVHASADY